MDAKVWIMKDSYGNWFVVIDLGLSTKLEVYITDRKAKELGMILPTR